MSLEAKASRHRVPTPASARVALPTAATIGLLRHACTREPVAHRSPRPQRLSAGLGPALAEPGCRDFK
eukprot:3242802-Prymnesium_polylepis.1